MPIVFITQPLSCQEAFLALDPTLAIVILQVRGSRLGWTPDRQG
jgi:hypothetical protein